MPFFIGYVTFPKFYIQVILKYLKKKEILKANRRIWAFGALNRILQETPELPTDSTQIYAAG